MELQLCGSLGHVFPPETTHFHTILTQRLVDQCFLKMFRCTHIIWDAVNSDSAGLGRGPRVCAPEHSEVVVLQPADLPLSSKTGEEPECAEMRPGQSRGFPPLKGGQLRCYGRNVCVPPISHVERLAGNMMAFRGGASRR